MTTPPEPTPVPPEDRPATLTLRSRVKDLEAVVALLKGQLNEAHQLIAGYAQNDTALLRENAELQAALKRYATHAFTCLSEHGRYPSRCSCGLHEVLR